MSNSFEYLGQHEHIPLDNLLIEHIEGYADGTELKARGGNIPTMDIVAVQNGFPQSWTTINGSDIIYIPNEIGNTPNTTEYKAMVIFEFEFSMGREIPDSEGIASFRWTLNGTPILTKGEQVVGSQILYSSQVRLRLKVEIDSTLGGDDLANGKIKSHIDPINVNCEIFEYSASTEVQLFRPVYYENLTAGSQLKVIKPRISIDAYGYNETTAGGASGTHVHPFEELFDDPAPRLSASMDANFKNITNINNLAGAVATLTTTNSTNLNSTTITNAGNIDSASLHTSAQIDTRNINIDVATAPDVAHAGDGLQNIIQNTGDLYKDVALGQDVLNNIYGFPQGNSITYFKGFPLMNNILVMKTRDAAGVPVPIGYNRLSLTGSTASFQDRVFYDPLALRCEKVSTAFTRIKVRPSVLNMMWNFRVHYDFDFPVRNPDNRVRIYVEQFRGGASLRTYKLLDLFTNNIENVGSAERMINGGGMGEDVILDDEFALYLCCDAGSPNQIQVCRYVQWCVYITPLI